MPVVRKNRVLLTPATAVPILDSVAAHVASKLQEFGTDERTLTDELCDMFCIWSDAARIDQVLYSCVQVLLPATMLLLLGTTLWVWASTSTSSTWIGIDSVVNWILGIVGALFFLMFPAIAVYGFYHRRRLVGNLVVDAMPGS